MVSVTVHWPRVPNEHGGTTLWFGSWLVGDSGGEGAKFYSGRGGDVDTYVAPHRATGLRIRRWPNEGLDAEYADVLELPPGQSLSADDLDFDTRQKYANIPGID